MRCRGIGRTLENINQYVARLIITLKVQGYEGRGWKTKCSSKVMALILRSDKASKRRKYWNWYHQWVGRLALFLGFLNIVIGLCVAEAGSARKIGYGFLAFFILATVAVLEASLDLGRS